MRHFDICVHLFGTDASFMDRLFLPAVAGDDKTGNVRINVTLRLVFETIVTLEKQ
jgi:hypothetical protein